MPTGDVPGPARKFRVGHGPTGRCTTPFHSEDDQVCTRGRWFKGYEIRELQPIVFFGSI